MQLWAGRVYQGTLPAVVQEARPVGLHNLQLLLHAHHLCATVTPRHHVDVEPAGVQIFIAAACTMDRGGSRMVMYAKQPRALPLRAAAGGVRAGRRQNGHLSFLEGDVAVSHGGGGLGGGGGLCRVPLGVGQGRLQVAPLGLLRQLHRLHLHRPHPQPRLAPLRPALPTLSDRIALKQVDTTTEFAHDDDGARVLPT